MVSNTALQASKWAGCAAVPVLHWRVWQLDSLSIFLDLPAAFRAGESDWSCNQWIHQTAWFLDGTVHQHQAPASHTAKTLMLCHHMLCWEMVPNFDKHENEIQAVCGEGFRTRTNSGKHCRVLWILTAKPPHQPVVSDLCVYSEPHKNPEGRLLMFEGARCFERTHWQNPLCGSTKRGCDTS